MKTKSEKLPAFRNMTNEQKTVYVRAYQDALMALKVPPDGSRQAIAYRNRSQLLAKAHWKALRAVQHYENEFV